MRSAYMHMLGDAISAAGVVVAGLVVAFTGVSTADPMVSVLIGILILWSSWGILKEAVNVLLEAIPAGMDMAAVEQTIGGVHGVRAVTEELENRFGIAHTTIQVEVEGCEPNDMYCVKRAAEHAGRREPH